MKRGGFVKRSACLQRIRCNRRLVLERSRSNGGLFSCFSARHMLDGWKIMKQSEAGDAVFFLLEAGQPASRKRILLQERIVRMHGITAKPSLSRQRAALQLPTTGDSWPVGMARGGLWLVAKASAARVVAR